jgi:hypothetical protein
MVNDPNAGFGQPQVLPGGFPAINQPAVPPGTIQINPGGGNPVIPDDINALVERLIELQVRVNKHQSWLSHYQGQASAGVTFDLAAEMMQALWGLTWGPQLVEAPAEAVAARDVGHAIIGATSTTYDDLVALENELTTALIQGADPAVIQQLRESIQALKESEVDNYSGFIELVGEGSAAANHVSAFQSRVDALTELIDKSGGINSLAEQPHLWAQMSDTEKAIINRMSPDLAAALNALPAPTSAGITPPSFTGGAGLKDTDGGGDGTGGGDGGPRQIGEPGQLTQAEQIPQIDPIGSTKFGPLFLGPDVKDTRSTPDDAVILRTSPGEGGAGRILRFDFKAPGKGSVQIGLNELARGQTDLEQVISDLGLDQQTADGLRAIEANEQQFRRQILASRRGLTEEEVEQLQADLQSDNAFVRSAAHAKLNLGTDISRPEVVDPRATRNTLGGSGQTGQGGSADSEARRQDALRRAQEQVLQNRELLEAQLIRLSQADPFIDFHFRDILSAYDAEFILGKFRDVEGKTPKPPKSRDFSPEGFINQFVQEFLSRPAQGGVSRTVTL